VLDADGTTAVREADGRARWEHGIDLTRAWARSRPRGEVGLVAAGDVPALVAAPTEAREEVVEALDRAVARGTLRPSEGAADLAAAIRLATTAAGRRGRGHVVVLSAREVAAPEATTGVRVSLVGTGLASGDQGVVDLRIERREGKVEAAVLVTVENFDRAPATRRLVATLGEATLLDAELELPAGGTREATFAAVAPREGAWLRVGLAGDDVYGRNDRAAAWLAGPFRPSVLVAHAGAVRPYTAAILAALGDRIDGERSGAVAAADLPAAAPRDVVLVDGAVLGKDALRPGGWLFLAPLGGALPFETGRSLREPLVWRTLPGHPLVRDLDLSTALVARATTLRGEGLTGLAFTEGEPVLAEGERDGVRYVVLGLDPEESDLPVRAALPLLVRNAILRLAEAPTAPLAPFYRAGEVLRPRAPIPGGPVARLRWGGARQATARLDPEGEGWRVPAGASGEVEVETGEGERRWVGRTAFLDLDPERTVAPARPPGDPPPPAPPVTDDEALFRRVLLGLSVLLLLLDLALLARGPARRAAPGAP
jgi:hypothetical protein